MIPVRVRASVGLAAALVHVAMPRAAHASEEIPNCVQDARHPRCERALQLHDEAQRLYAEGRYRDAILRLDEAVASDPNGGQLFYNIGKINELLGELEPALRGYRRALELEPNPSERDRIQAIVRRIESALAAKQFERALAPPPPPRPRGPHPLRPWMLATGGVALGSLAVGGALAAHAWKVAPGVEASTGAGTSIDSLQAGAEQARSSAIGADVFLGIAAASAVASITLGILASAPDAPAAAATKRVALSVGAGPASISLRWQFQ